MPKRTLEDREEAKILQLIKNTPLWFPKGATEEEKIKIIKEQMLGTSKKSGGSKRKTVRRRKIKTVKRRKAKTHRKRK